LVEFVLSTRLKANHPMAADDQKIPRIRYVKERTLGRQGTQMQLAAEPGMFVGLESSTNLLAWRTVTNTTLTEESITFLHTNSALQQFYRAVPLR
jgi:hypothetical protein